MLIPFSRKFAPGKSVTDNSSSEATLNVTDVRRHIRFYSPFFIDGIKSWPAQCIWSTLFFLGLALTIKDIVDQVVIFDSQPTTTLTKLVFNESIQFAEDVTLCVEIDTVRMNFVDKKRFVNATETLEIISHFAAVPNILQFLGTLNHFDNQPNRSFVALTTKMIANVLLMENYVSVNLTNELIGKWAQAYSPKHPEMSESLALAHQFYRSRGVSMSALKSTVGYLLCRQMRTSLRVFKDQKNGQSSLENFDICDPKLLSWLGKCPFDEAADQICFRYPKEMSTMRSLNDYIVLVVMPQALYNDANELEVSKANYAYVNFAGDRVVSDSNNDIQVTLQRHANALLQLSGRYMAINTRNSPCTADESHFDCRGTCRAKKIGEICGCWPFSWDSLKAKPAEMAYCGDGFTGEKGIIPKIGEFSCLANISITYDIDPDCKQSCLRKCEAMVIGTTLSDCYDCDEMSDLDQNVTILNMTFNRFEHPVFEESITMDWTALTVNIGGIFALWLGMSVLSLFDLSYYLFRVARHFIRRRMSQRRLRTSTDSNVTMTTLDNFNNNYDKTDSLSSRSNSVATADSSPLNSVNDKLYQRAMQILSGTGLSTADSQLFLRSPNGQLALLAAEQSEDKNLFFVVLSCFGSLQKQLRDLQVLPPEDSDAEKLPFTGDIP